MIEPKNVCAVAERYGYEQIFFSASKGIIVLGETKTSDCDAVYLSTVTVWYRNETVGVELPHPRRNSVQSFFFEVNSLVGLEKILADTTLTGSGRYLRVPTPVETPAQSLAAALEHQLHALDAEERDISIERALLVSKLQSLSADASHPQPNVIHNSPTTTVCETGDRASVDEGGGAPKSEQQGNSKDRYFTEPTHSEKITLPEDGRLALPVCTASDTQAVALANGEAKNCDVAVSRAPQRNSFVTQKSYSLSSDNNNGVGKMRQRDSPSRIKGNRCVFCLCDDRYHEEFRRAWSAKPVRSVSLDRGYIIVYEDGGVAWWDIPADLEQNFRNYEVQLPPVQFVTLGYKGHYFVKYATGKMEWTAHTSFETAIRRGVSQHKFSVQSVALGVESSWVIVWSHGLVEFNNVPDDLGALLRSVNSPGATSLLDVNLGPRDEWCVLYEDHSVQASNLPSLLYNTLLKIKEEGGRLRSIAFGHEASWYVRYWDAKISS